MCFFFESDTEEYLVREKNDREQIFKDKCARLKIWINSAKKLKSAEQMMIAGEEMLSAADNLESIYYKLLKEGKSI